MLLSETGRLRLAAAINAVQNQRRGATQRTMGSFALAVMTEGLLESRDPVRGPWVSWVTASLGSGIIGSRAGTGY